MILLFSAQQCQFKIPLGLFSKILVFRIHKIGETPGVP